MTRKRHRWIRRLLIALGATALGVTALAGALMYRPGWYVPVPIDRGRLDSDNRDLVNLLDRIGVALNHGQSIDIELDQDQVNRWIAARDEWPEAVQRLDLGPLTDPLVLFESEGEVRLAATVRLSDVTVVISSDVRIEVAGDRVNLRLATARVGAAPVPRSLIDRFSREMRVDHPETRRLLHAGETSLPNEWVWPNGKRRFRIDSCASESGRLRIRLESL